jgi:hypothetical protein
LARYIREETSWVDGQGTPVPKEAIKEFYTKLWCNKPITALRFDPSPPADSSPILDYSAISPREINTRIARLKKDVAPGPDNIEKKHTTDPSAKEALRLFLNVIMISGTLPTLWNSNRTTLIPKPGKGPSRIENFRPITICLYWGIMDSRLRDRTTFSNRQKGVVYESGCFNNAHIFNEITKSAKTNKGITVVQFDITKACDTLPHAIIHPALNRLGIPQELSSSMCNSYINLTTTIGYRGSNVEVPILGGEKQGHTLPPLLFNAVMDPLIEQLENLKGYHINATHTISSIEFADDLLLLDDSREKAQHLLNLTKQYLQNLGVKIAASKCTTFEIVTTKDSWYVVKPQSIPGERLIHPTDTGRWYHSLSGWSVLPMDMTTIQGYQ